MPECKHGLTDQTCTRCRYPRIKDREPVHSGTINRQRGGFPARFNSGKCAACGERIYAGEMIVGRPEGYAHSSCVEDVAI